MPPPLIGHCNQPTLARALDKGASGSYVQLMKTVGLKTLKNKLSEDVRLADESHELGAAFSERRKPDPDKFGY